MNTNITNTTTNNTNTKTMSSLEIANLVESRHDSVKRTVERLVESGIIGQPPLVDDLFVDAQGKTRTTKVYLIDQRSSYVIVAQLSPAFTARLVDRWQELEAQVASQVSSTPAFKIPSTLGEALTLAAALEVERETLALVNKEQAEQITANAPLVKFAEDVSNSEDLILVRDLAKILAGNGFKIGQNSLFDKLQSEGYLLQDNKPSQKAMNLGLFKLVESVYKSGNTKHISFTTRVTGKGQIYFVNRYCNIKPQHLAIVA
jgi:phage antirepressor YoqD-like protein